MCHCVIYNIVVIIHWDVTDTYGLPARGSFFYFTDISWSVTLTSHDILHTAAIQNNNCAVHIKLVKSKILHLRTKHCKCHVMLSPKRQHVWTNSDERQPDQQHTDNNSVTRFQLMATPKTNVDKMYVHMARRITPNMTVWKTIWCKGVKLSNYLGTWRHIGRIQNTLLYAKRNQNRKLLSGNVLFFWFISFNFAY